MRRDGGCTHSSLKTISCASRLWPSRRSTEPLLGTPGKLGFLNLGGQASQAKALGSTVDPHKRDYPYPHGKQTEPVLTGASYNIQVSDHGNIVSFKVILNPHKDSYSSTHPMLQGHVMGM